MIRASYCVRSTLVAVIWKRPSEISTGTQANACRIHQHAGDLTTYEDMFQSFKLFQRQLYVALS